MTLSGSNSIVGQVGQLALRDPLVGRAEVLADVGAEVVDPAVEQGPGDAAPAESSSLENRPTFSAVRIRSTTASSGRPARFVRYASSQLSFTRANASCMLLTCGTTSNRSLPSRSHR